MDKKRIRARWKQEIALAFAILEKYPAPKLIPISEIESGELIGDIFDSYARLLALCPNQNSSEYLFSALPDIANAFFAFLREIDSAIEKQENFGIDFLEDFPDKPFYLVGALWHAYRKTNRVKFFDS